MKSIKISDVDAQLLSPVYEQELMKAKERVSELEKLLAQIGGKRKRARGRPKGSKSSPTRGRPKGSGTKRATKGLAKRGRPKGVAKRGRPKGVAKRGRPKGSLSKRTAKTTSRKRGRKPLSGKWNTFILGRLKHSKSPVPITTLVESGMKQFGEKDAKRMRQNVNNTLTALRKKGVVKSVGGKGKREKSIELTG